jgi:hypothetical protein
VQQWCRPEITVFKLCVAPEDEASTNAIASAETVESSGAPENGQSPDSAAQCPGA